MASAVSAPGMEWGDGWYRRIKDVIFSDMSAEAQEADVERCAKRALDDDDDDDDRHADKRAREDEEAEDAALALAADEAEEAILDAEGAAAVDAIENVTGGIVLDARQLDCVMYAKEGKNFIVLGSAGTGKSTVIDTMVKVLENKYRTEPRRKDMPPKGIALLASTGRAAGNIGGVTVNSYFKYTTQYGSDGVLRNSGAWRATFRNPMHKGKLRGLGTIILDEVSMWQSDLFDEISMLLQEARECTLPFGGVQVIVVGDFYQLPPVATFPENHKHFPKQSQYCFLSAEFGRTFAESKEAYDTFVCEDGTVSLSVCRHVLLTVSRRQGDDATFFSLLENLRHGCLTRDNRALLSQQMVLGPDAVPPGIMRLFATNEQVRVYNEEQLRRMFGAKIATHGFLMHGTIKPDGILTPTTGLPLEPGATVAGVTMPTMAEVEERFRVQRVNTLRVGCRGLILANQDVAGGVFNGAMCTVIGVKGPSGPMWTGEDGSAMPVMPDVPEEGVGIVVQLDGVARSVVITRQLFRMPMTTTTTLALYSQFPILLGYAMTVHRCQGTTLPAGVCIDVSKMNTSGQLYVALSRCTNLERVFLIRWTGNSVDEPSPAVKWFYT